MSFVRVQTSKPSATMISSGKPKRKKVTKKDAWDDTQSDLSVYKLSRHELERRHAIHKSHNLSSVKLEKQQQALAKALKRTPPSEGRTRVSLLREMLYDGDELQDVLAHTDRVMAVVKDLFGDDPKRYTGLPNVTFAPGQDNNSQTDRSMMSISQSTEIPARFTQPDPPVLNEVSEDIESDSEEETTQDKNTQMEAEKDGQPTSLSAVDNLMCTPEHQRIMSEEETPKGLAINDTIKVRKTKKRMENMDETENVSIATNLDGLKRVITGLEQEVEEYEQLTGRQRPSRPTKDTEGLGGYTASLLDTISKLVSYLKENEKVIQSETKIREEIQADLQEHRELTDALTAELLLTQDQFLGLQTEFEKYRASTDSQLNYLKHTVYSILKSPATVPQPQPPKQQPPPLVPQNQGFQPYQPQARIPQPQLQPQPIVVSAPVQPDVPVVTQPELNRDGNTNSAGDLQGTDKDVEETLDKNDSTAELAEQFTAALSTVPAYVKPLQTAVMLSPPRQRDRSTLHRPGMTLQEVSPEPIDASTSTTEVRMVTVTTTSSNVQPYHADLTNQIATLTEQRSQAQARLQALQSYRRPLSDAGNIGNTMELVVKNHHHRAVVNQGSSVSPPISPIPHDRPVPSKTIAVTLPRVEELELSASSTPSPKYVQGKENRLNDVPVRTINNIMGVANNGKHQDSSNGGFFALSSHMSQ
ncbi:spindle and centriole-associated protein 1-like [Glandiceps talaboti]